MDIYSSNTQRAELHRPFYPEQLIEKMSVAVTLFAYAKAGLNRCIHLYMLSASKITQHIK